MTDLNSDRIVVDFFFSRMISHLVYRHTLDDFAVKTDDEI